MKTKYTAGPIPEAAIKYLKAKKLKTSFNYYEVWKEEHHTAFTAAKVMELDILSDVQESLIDALNEGIPFEKWQREIRSTMDKSGWSDYHKDTPIKRRLDIIYDTNIRVSQIVGQWDRIEETKDTAPYLLYQLGTAAKHRDEHAAWEGTLLPVDDPWWDDHMPLNAYGCKCWVLQVSKPRAERLGGVTPRPKQNELVEWKNKYTGKTEKIEKGIGPGWDTNLGKTRNKVYEQSVKNAKIKNDYYKKELSKAIKKKK